uniref:Uncharacterized protein n=1 Tax=Rhizophora mucronata TaxID=61149 RepID=A0A2P2PPJ1_RHIMU
MGQAKTFLVLLESFSSTMGSVGLASMKEEEEARTAFGAKQSLKAAVLYGLNKSRFE